MICMNRYLKRKIGLPLQNAFIEVFNRKIAKRRKKMKNVLYKISICALMACGAYCSETLQDAAPSKTDQQIQNQQNTQEIQNLTQEIIDFKNAAPDEINLVIGNGVSSQFETMQNTIFIDPLLEHTQSKEGTNLFIKASLTDFLNLVQNTPELYNSLRKSFRLIYDDFNKTPDESSDQGMISFNEKFKMYLDFLGDNGRIVTNSRSVSGDQFGTVSSQFNVSFYSNNTDKDNISTEEIADLKKGLWHFDPIKAFSEVSKARENNEQYLDIMERWGMDEEEYNMLSDFFSMPESESAMKSLKMAMEDFDRLSSFFHTKMQKEFDRFMDRMLELSPIKE